MMKNAIPVVMAAVVATLTAAPVRAEATDSIPVMVDRLGKCLVGKSTGQDRIALASWMLAAMASAPQLNGVATITVERKEEVDRKFAGIFLRLMTVDCSDDAKALLTTGDASAFGMATAPLGQIAMTELTGSPQFNAAIGNFVKFMDPAALAHLKE